MRAFDVRLRELGITIFEPYLHSGQAEWTSLSDEYKKFVALGLTHDHLYKIRIADVVYIFNKNGYCGVSTTLEIGAAVALGKPIYAMEPDAELCRHTLFREIIDTPDELVKRLQ